MAKKTVAEETAKQVPRSEQLVAKVQDIISMAEGLGPARTITVDNINQVQDIRDDTNEFLGWAMDNYQGIPTSKQVDDFFAVRDSFVPNVQAVKALPESIVVVAIAYYLIRKKAMIVERLDPNVTRFYYRYNDILSQFEETNRPPVRDGADD